MFISPFFPSSLFPSLLTTVAHTTRASSLDHLLYVSFLAASVIPPWYAAAVIPSFCVRFLARSSASALVDT